MELDAGDLWISLDKAPTRFLERKGEESGQMTIIMDVL